MNIVAFTFESHEVRTVVINGEPWFVLADLCKALDLTNPSMVADRIDSDALSTTEVIDRMGRAQTARIVSEAGLYEVVFLSRKPEAKAFKRWMTHEVIPSIRKTGRYGVAELTRADLARMVLEAETELTQAKAELEVAAPKALFADAVAASDGTILVGELAKILRGNGIEMGQNRLFAWLREWGYLIRRNGSDRNMPTQRSMEMGLFVIKETAITHSDGHVTISKTPKVTGKGQQYFVNAFLSKAVA